MSSAGHPHSVAEAVPHAVSETVPHSAAGPAPYAVPQSADFRAAVAFLTPLGNGTAPPSPMTMAYFPIVGASLGALVGVAWRIALRRLPPLPAAALTVAVDCIATGGLHLDGLADTADGLLAHVPTNSRLEIMAEPEVGTFGSLALGIVLISRTAALSAIKPSPALLAALYCSSRSVMVIGSRALPYAREDGLATAFLPTASGAGSAAPDRALRAGLAGAAAALLLASLVGGRRGARAVVGGWVSGALVLALARRRVGGFTGDVLGAAGLACETTGLVITAAK